MKKKLLVCLLVSIMASSFAVPVMAAEAADVKQVYTSMVEEIAPRNEQTRAYFRIYHGVLQSRVWSVTRVRWINDWANVN